MNQDNIMLVCDLRGQKTICTVFATMMSVSGAKPLENEIIILLSLCFQVYNMFHPLELNNIIVFPMVLKSNSTYCFSYVRFECNIINCETI